MVAPFPAEHQIRLFDELIDVIEIGAPFEVAILADGFDVIGRINPGLDNLADFPEWSQAHINPAIQGDNLFKGKSPGPLKGMGAEIAIESPHLPQETGQFGTFDMAIPAGLLARPGVIERKDDMEIIAERRENQPVQEFHHIAQRMGRFIRWSISLPVGNLIFQILVITVFLIVAMVGPRGAISSILTCNPFLGPQPL